MQISDTRINYIRQMNAFWQKLHDEGPVRASSGMIYFALLERNNRLGWRKEFSVDYEVIMDMASVSKNTYYEALKELSARGFINYTKSANRALCGKISINVLSQNLGIEKESNCEPYCEPNCEPYCESSMTLNKQEKGKHLKTGKQENIMADGLTPFIHHSDDSIKQSGKKEKSSAKKEKDYLEVINRSLIDTCCQFSDEFQELWLNLLQTPKWRKKEQSAINMALTQLMRFDEEFAIKQVESAISGNWQGVVFPNTDAEYIKWRNGTQTTGQQKPVRGLEAAMSILNIQRR